MIKKDITFENLDGEMTTQTHYFHLSKDRLVDMEVDKPGGLVAYLEGVVKSGEPKAILSAFRDIISAAYGVRVSADDFEQTPEISAKFSRSLAYSALFDEITSDEKVMAEFINGIVPKGLQQSKAQIEKILAEVNDPQPAGSGAITESGRAMEDRASGLKNPRDDDGNLLPWAFRKPTDREVQSMSQIRLQEVSIRAFSDWVPPAVLGD